MPFRRSISAVLLSRSVGQWNARSPSCQPKRSASSNSSEKWEHGAAYLLWIGVKSLFTKDQSNINVEGVKSSLWDAAKDGVLISLLNPKLAIFFIALFSQFVSVEMPGLNQLIIVSTVTLVDGTWYILVAIALSHSSVLTKLNKKSTMINRVSGIVLIGLAVRVVTL